MKERKNGKERNSISFHFIYFNFNLIESITCEMTWYCTVQYCLSSRKEESRILSCSIIMIRDEWHCSTTQLLPSTSSTTGLNVMRGLGVGTCSRYVVYKICIFVLTGGGRHEEREA